MLHQFFTYLLKNQFVLVLFLIIIGWFVFQTRGILTSIFVSYIIMAALLPYVRFFQRKGFPRILAVVIPYVTVILIAFLIVYPLIPFTFSQVQSLLSNLPTFVDQSAKTLGFSIDANEIEKIVSSEIKNIGKNAFAVTSAVFGGVFSLLTILIVGFYLLLYHENFRHAIANMFHKEKHEMVFRTLGQIDEKLGAWLRGQLVLSATIGVVTFLALTILGVPYALPLAVLAGVLEVIPTLGPTLAAIPAVIVALTITPSLALIVIITYVIIQMLENNFLVPKIMQKAVGLNPVIVIIGVMVGANLMGVTGALLSIPFISFLVVLFSSIQKNFEEE